MSNYPFDENKKKPYNYDDSIDFNTGRLTNIDYQTDWILKELKITNNLLRDEIKLNRYIIRLIEHMLEKSDNPELMRKSVKMEMARGIR